MVKNIQKAGETNDTSTVYSHQQQDNVSALVARQWGKILIITVSVLVIMCNNGSHLRVGTPRGPPHI